MSIRDTGYEYDRLHVYAARPQGTPESTDGSAAGGGGHEELRTTPDELAVAALVQYINNKSDPDGPEPDDGDIDRVRKRDDLKMRIIDKANFLIGDNDPTKQFQRISRSIATRNARELKQQQDQNFRRRA